MVLQFWYLFALTITVKLRGLNAPSVAKLTVAIIEVVPEIHCADSQWPHR